MIRPGTALRWQKPTVRTEVSPLPSETAWERKRASRQLPSLQDFLRRRDYSGAITLLQYETEQGMKRPELRLWLAYCYFHAGLYPKAIHCLDWLLQRGKRCSANAHKNNEGASVEAQVDAANSVEVRESGCESDWVKRVVSGSDGPALEKSDSAENCVTKNEYNATPDALPACDAEVDVDEEDGDGGDTPERSSRLHLYKAICLYALYMFEAAKQEALLAQDSKARRRLLVCIAHHLRDPALDEMLEDLDEDDFRDQMTTAAVEYMRGRTDVACDIYRRLLSHHCECHALKIYYAMAAFKGEMFEIARGLVKDYQACRTTSVVASNVMACCLYEEDADASALKIYHLLGEEAGREETFFIQHNDILRHNACVFENGRRGLQVWGPLVKILPEARLNLTLLHISNGDYSSAFELMRDYEPATTTDSTIRALAFMLFGQAHDSEKHLSEAEQMFRTVGNADLGVDSLPGMQSMFYYYFLRRDYDAALDYAGRLEPYFSSEPSFQWNKALALGQEGRYEEAKDMLLRIDDEEYIKDLLFLRWLCRVYVATGDCEHALHLCLQQSDSSHCHALLKEVADDCYAIGDFYFALKAFFLLDKAEGNPLLWPALRGSAAGFLVRLSAGDEDITRLKEVVSLVQECSAPKVAKIVVALRKLGRNNGIILD
ncbi:putative tetratricopeptide repeat protein 26 [Toxoplasma gondii MAS]|uniref:Putative tetratricopeptide repeat protein 26 n=1 Tax=Toxoplasma gondii MAS TaxID=943118 RepID=A0A086PLK5_TOXGO|nr:putative tetratricopeptide repeat protein 26 [Toxoplasma gondii MAS]